MVSPNSKSIAKSGLWMTISFALGKIAQLLSQIILARLLSPNEFGIWAMVLILSNFSVLFRDTAIAQVLVQRGLENKNIVNTVYSLGVNISICLFIIQAIAGFPLSMFFGVPMLFPLVAFTALVFLIGAGAGSHAAVMQRQMKFRELAISDLLANFTRVIAAITCAFLGWGVWSFAVGEVAMSLVDSLLKHSLSKYKFTYSLKLDVTAVGEVKKFITGIIGASLAVQINTMSDNIIIGKLLGKQALGNYNLAYQLAMTPAYVMSQVNRVILSVLSQRDNIGKKVFLSQSLEIYAVAFALIYGVTFVVAPWLIPLLYGSDWKDAVPLFQILLIFAYARGFMAILGNALLSLDKAMTNAVINWALVPLAILSYLVGVNLAGSQGVAIAVALVMGVGATIWFWFATCYAAGWEVLYLIKPVLLPTFTIALSLFLILAIPYPDVLVIYLQPISLVLFYITGISIFSRGRIIKNLVKIIKSTKHSRSLNKHESSK
jgi:lipopolysaccharide exporter